MQPVLVIGTGKWGNKITSILSNEFQELTNLSARDITDKYLIKYGEENANPVIWIATYPELQIQLLDKLNGRRQYAKVILEKPIFTSLEQAARFESAVRDSNFLELHFSEPWTYSQLWAQLENKISTYDGQIDIHAVRSGNIKRDYLNPPQDWLSHDIYLMSSLSRRLNLKIACLTTEWAPDYSYFRAQFQIGEQIKLLIEGGYSIENRRAFWEAKFKSESVVIDFTASDYSILSSDRERIGYISFVEDHPLINLLHHVVKTKGENNISKKITEQKWLCPDMAGE
jgi:hypothetical protein